MNVTTTDPVDPQGSLNTLLVAQNVVATTFTWLFQGSKAVFFFFLWYILYRYGHIRLSKNENDKPEFSSLATIAMIVTGGAGPVFLSYCVAEPLFHQHSHFFAQAGYHSQDEVDMFAINMTVSNWGLTTWVTFTMVAVGTALAVHRFGLPLTFRSNFYPILGAYTWGWMGDIIDGLVIVLMFLGVCSQLCLNTVHVVSGFVYLGWIDEGSIEQEITTVQKTTVWVITFISCASVMTGLHGGIRIVSLLAACVALFLALLVLASDDTKYILNLQVQELGYHLQNSIFQINFWTDAFGQIQEGSGRAVDGKAAEQWWMSSWIVYYQAWT
jgi:choline-glycine betaine transporter